MHDTTAETIAETRPHAAETLIVEEQGDGFFAVLLPLDERVLITNDTGRRVLALCDGGRDTDEIAASLAASFPSVPLEQIHNEVHSFLEAATARGAVTW